VSIDTYLGVGVGLREPHYPELLRGNGAPARWVEVNAEKYIAGADGDHDAHLQVLKFVRETMPVVLHGTSMSLGSAREENADYLAQLTELCNIIEPEFVSDHLCWSGINGIKLYDLLPLPFTQETLDVVVPRILAAQDVLRRPILVENLSTYLEFSCSEMSEWQFVSEVVRRTGCYLLLDINNVYVSCSNHGWDPHEFLRGIPHDRVRQIHLAGHFDSGALKIDTHGELVAEPVWELFAWYTAQYGAVSTMIEWDKNLPVWSVLAAELGKIEAIIDAARVAEARCA
jgi:uncharacterized protein